MPKNQFSHFVLHRVNELFHFFFWFFSSLNYAVWQSWIKFLFSHHFWCLGGITSSIKRKRFIQDLFENKFNAKKFGILFFKSTTWQLLQFPEIHYIIWKLLLVKLLHELNLKLFSGASQRLSFLKTLNKEFIKFFFRLAI